MRKMRNLRAAAREFQAELNQSFFNDPLRYCREMRNLLEKLDDEHLDQPSFLQPFLDNLSATADFAAGVGAIYVGYQHLESKGLSFSRAVGDDTTVYLRSPLLTKPDHFEMNCELRLVAANMLMRTLQTLRGALYAIANIRRDATFFLFTPQSVRIPKHDVELLGLAGLMIRDYAELFKVEILQGEPNVVAAETAFNTRLLEHLQAAGLLAGVEDGKECEEILLRLRYYASSLTPARTIVTRTSFQNEEDTLYFYQIEQPLVTKTPEQRQAILAFARQENDESQRNAAERVIDRVFADVLAGDHPMSPQVRKIMPFGVRHAFLSSLRVDDSQGRSELLTQFVRSGTLAPQYGKTFAKMPGGFRQLATSVVEQNIAQLEACLAALGVNRSIEPVILYTDSRTGNREDLMYQATMAVVTRERTKRAAHYFPQNKLGAHLASTSRLKTAGQLLLPGNVEAMGVMSRRTFEAALAINLLALEKAIIAAAHCASGQDRTFRVCQVAYELAVCAYIYGKYALHLRTDEVGREVFAAGRHHAYMAHCNALGSFGAKPAVVMNGNLPSPAVLKIIAPEVARAMTHDIAETNKRAPHRFTPDQDSVNVLRRFEQGWHFREAYERKFTDRAALLMRPMSQAGGGAVLSREASQDRLHVELSRRRSSTTGGNSKVTTAYVSWGKLVAEPGLSPLLDLYYRIQLARDCLRVSNFSDNSRVVALMRELLSEALFNELFPQSGTKRALLIRFFEIVERAIVEAYKKAWQDGFSARKGDVISVSSFELQFCVTVLNKQDGLLRGERELHPYQQRFLDDLRGVRGFCLYLCDKLAALELGAASVVDAREEVDSSVALSQNPSALMAGRGAGATADDSDSSEDEVEAKTTP